MKLSVLDQSPIRAGQAPDAAIRESLDLARACEAFGYHRYWLSEHHNLESVAGSAPEILAAAIAATTSRIRVGSAGVMLPHYAALKVAEQFRVLEAIAPGRIDLGVGRAPGGDGRTAFALNPNAARAADQFPAQIQELQAWTSNTPLPDKHPFRSVMAMPTGPCAPEIWVLGSSLYGAQLAAALGLPYAFAYFFTDGEGAAEAIALYRQNFRPSATLSQPYCAATIWALAAPTLAEAEYWYSSRAIAWALRGRGRFIPLPAPEDAAKIELTPPEQASLNAARARAFIGTGPDVAEKLRALGQALQLDEIAITSAAFDPATRTRGYELLAREFGLTGQGIQSAL